MSKLSPKQEAQICHTIVVLISLLGDYTDELIPNTPTALNIKEKALELMPLCDALLSAVYDVPEIKSGTYLHEISNKIDTIIRKNFQQII
jgi:hypothetical protein